MLLTKISSASGSSFAAGEIRGLRGLTFHPCSFIDVPHPAGHAASGSGNTVSLRDHSGPVKHAICKDILTVLPLGNCQAQRGRLRAPGRRATALLVSFGLPV